MKNLGCTALVALIGTFIVHSQEKSELIQQRIEFIAEQFQSESLDLSYLTEVLTNYLEHPLNLNAVEEEELNALLLLSELQINAFLLHRKLFGKFMTIFELQSIDHWDQETIDRLLPFVRVDDKLDQLHLSFKEALRQGAYEATLRYQTIPQHKLGYDKVSDSVQLLSNSYYHGNKDHYYARLRYTYRTNLSVGLTAEKDPGEAFFRAAQRYGFDFYSAHAFFNGGKYLKSFALGDYQVQCGQGLNFWSGYAFNKSVDVMAIKKTAQALRPYSAVDENRFLRGAAIELGVGPWRMLTFASYKRIDAGINVDTTSVFSSFATGIESSGLHRTTDEITRRNALKETVGGTSLRFRSTHFQLGVQAIYLEYDKMILKDTLPYNQFDFRGDRLLSTSMDYSVVIKNAHFFGEFSFLPLTKAMAQLHGVLLALHPRCSLSALYRMYQRNYAGVYTAGFSENGKNQNENGLYMALKYQFNRSFVLNAYVDIFKFPWMNYQVSSATKGNEVLVQLTFKPSKTFEIYARYRKQLHQKNSRDLDETVAFNEDVLQENFRMNLSFSANETLTFRSRIEWVHIHRPSNTPEKGLVLFGDLIYKPKSLPLDLSLRYALFDTDSYDSRIYAYENNALNVFSIPAIYGQGSRGYVLLRWTFLRHCDLWFRYGVSVYAHRLSIGTGSEEIGGAKKSDITLQFRVKF
ncbi:MAG: hypothetical protein RL632_2088 [Bacteroidota bacterium]